MIGSLRECVPGLLRTLCVVTALCAAAVGSSQEPPRLRAWHATAITAQIPGGGNPSDTRRINAALWFNSFADIATLQFASQGSAGVTRITLRCAAAGANGPAVWSSAPITNLSGVAFEILARHLTPVQASGGCPAVVNNIASLEAAAERRLLYLELERGSAPLRGQLWPSSFGLQAMGFGSPATASDQQVPSAAAQPPQWLRTAVTLWFSEFNQTLARVGYSVANRHRFLGASLHCAPPGQSGAAIAQLLADEGVLTQADLLPVDAAGPCGMAVNGNASLLEALARGNLYVEIELADPPGVKLRGQFLAPANGEHP